MLDVTTNGNLELTVGPELVYILPFVSKQNNLSVGSEIVGSFRSGGLHTSAPWCIGHVAPTFYAPSPSGFLFGTAENVTLCSVSVLSGFKVSLAPVTDVLGYVPQSLLSMS